MKPGLRRRAVTAAGCFVWLIWAGSDGLGAQQLAVEGDLVRVIFAPPGSPPGEGVALALRGEVYDRGLKIEIGEESESDMSVDEAGESLPAAAETRLLAEYFRAWRQGTYEDILAFWTPDALDVVQRYLSKDTFEPQSRFYEQAQWSRLIAKLHYGGYTLLVVEHGGSSIGSRARIYVVEPAGARLLLSYDLLADPVFLLWKNHLGEWLVGETAKRLGRDAE